ncbi:interactor of constitutive active ROPs 3-like isoform X1 [Canna indica]|uniref:Interactor of constitutive active ROPs 3-like isoform X1 n=1 Tax=Canna indica TaxID=4628 RepID=A0AAQ3QRE6_9LILI|nr:interactor of constitutive active ROPs 3-like isoform X1 [Canna indica]
MLAIALLLVLGDSTQGWLVRRYIHRMINMQISKTRTGSSEVPTTKTSSATLRSKHLTKVAGSESNFSSINPSQVPATRSPKIEGRGTKTMVTEKRRPSKVTELECQLTQLQEELMNTKDQLNSTELLKRQAQQEAEAAKHQFAIMHAKLKDSQSQMVELSASEESRIQELRKISQERDRAWQFELEAIEKQRSIDSTALASAKNEIRKLKLQLQMAAQSEAELSEKSIENHSKIQSSEKDLADALITIKNLKVQVRSSEKAEAEAKANITEMKKQLEIAQSTIESLLTDGSKLMESFSIVAAELKESRLQVRILEETVKKLQEENSIIHIQALVNFDSPKKICFDSSASEVEELVAAFEDTLIKYQQEQIESIVKIQCAYELMEKMSTDTKSRESELELRLTETKSEVNLLKAKLFDREIELQSLSKKNELLAETVNKEHQNDSEIGLQLAQSIADVADLKFKLAEKESTLAMISKENEQLKLEFKKTEMNSVKAKEDVTAMKLGFLFKEEELKEQMNESVVQELSAAQLEKIEMEAELRKLKVQADQWKKAAETAILMLTDESTTDVDCPSGDGKLMRLPFTDELDDQSSRKKKNNVLRRISGKWNKDHK